MQEVQHSDWGEVAWYFAQTREQFRLLGQLRVVTKDEQDQGLSKVIEETRHCFATWPSRHLLCNTQAFVGNRCNRRAAICGCLLV